ncbi:hypothetical protein EYZ11_013505 [Aspergillus tanneri]|uniref:Methyltransferase type 11 domain-containing protein n=1 Tax=Aspergillus tanneri TaxID=1220188 RepID=A0A4S3IXH9_9EURO|nr:uncharacterized protein ATNIH1004_008207 [Aspergillus tanneri]KAA8644011.1 hypothetical protein ATNIH1004_008207 [Aspergillus tanneri]THC87049.1 hypothetical protein EYZ11_013505 [Aspergillus tanneri]
MAQPTQNIYDNPTFFSAYSTLPRSAHGLDEAPEWPTLQQWITGSSSNIQNQRVLDLGCGYGWFARWARESRASYIRAIDVSERMIDRATEFDQQGDKSEHAQPETIRYEIGDLETITFDSQEKDSYGLVYSSLTFHYIEDLGRLFREIRACLIKPSSSDKDHTKRRGKLVFSVEHPVCTAPVVPAGDWKVVQDDQGVGRKFWPLNNYSEEGLRTTSWLGTEGVRKYHRTVETYVSLLLENGFVLTGLKDWVPSREDVERHPEWKDERHRPYFLLIAAEVWN